jgi:DNA-binding CsgD family transcriptional regulator/tetratricopeptide (TPR) repeat protein
MPPYLPLIEALGQHTRDCDRDRLSAQTGQNASTLSVILPELAARLGDVPRSYPLPPEQARLRLFEAVGAFLAEISGTQPLVLLLDDLQWADSATLELLSYVARSQPRLQLLVMGAYRDDEAPENPALQRALAALSRQRSLTVMRVGPLSQTETADLASWHLGAEVESELVELLYRYAEGNPFFAEELLAGWVDTGGVVHQAGRWGLAGSASQPLPLSIVATVQQRLGRLVPECVDSLRIASVIGRVFPVWLLAAAAGEGADVIEDRLQQTERAQLIEPRQDETFRFRHDLIRESLYREVTATKRRHLHEAIGRALEDRARVHGGIRLVDLAFHFARGESRERGITYARQAGYEALTHSALEEALGQFETALSLLEPDDERQGPVLLEVGDAALRAGKEDLAATRYESAQRALIKRDPVAAARAAHGLGVARLRQDSLLEAHLAFDAALQLFGEETAPEKVQVLVDLATLLSINLGREEEGVMRGRQALELARHVGDDRLRAVAGRAVGNLLVRGNQVTAGIAVLKDALVRASALDDAAEVAECCANLASASYWVADLDASRQYTDLREAAARRCQQPYELRHIHTWAAFLAATRGDWEQAETLLARARPIVDNLSSTEPLGFFHHITGFLAWERGDFDQATRALDQAIAIFRASSPGGLIWYLGPLGLCRQAIGNTTAAEAVLTELEALISAQPHGSLPAGSALNCALLLAVRLGDRERSTRYYPQLSAFSGQLHWTLVDRTLAAFELMRGGRTAADAYLDRAQRTARRAGMQRVLADVSDERERLKAGADARLPAGLSRREAEVLRLVASGMSNREIANQLNLSENTVAKHLTSIFNKTGSDNRAAAAAFATRYGLTE